MPIRPKASVAKVNVAGVRPRTKKKLKASAVAKSPTKRKRVVRSPAKVNVARESAAAKPENLEMNVKHYPDRRKK